MGSERPGEGTEKEREGKGEGEKIQSNHRRLFVHFANSFGSVSYRISNGISTFQHFGEVL